MQQGEGGLQRLQWTESYDQGRAKGGGAVLRTEAGCMPYVRCSGAGSSSGCGIIAGTCAGLDMTAIMMTVLMRYTAPAASPPAAPPRLGWPSRRTRSSTSSRPAGPGRCRPARSCLRPVHVQSSAV